MADKQVLKCLVHPDVKDMLAEMADKLGCSMANIVQVAVRYYWSSPGWKRTTRKVTDGNGSEGDDDDAGPEGSD
jgi:hypothetical protein